MRLMINHKSGVGHLLSNFVSSLSGQAVRVNIQLSGSWSLFHLGEKPIRVQGHDLASIELLVSSNPSLRSSTHVS